MRTLSDERAEGKRRAACVEDDTRARGGRTQARAPMALTGLAPGETATVTAVGGEGALRQHLLDMGVIPGVRMTFVKPAPMGDPLQFSVRGYSLTLRVADAEEVSIRKDTSADSSATGSHTTSPPSHPVTHPGIGESGIRHVRAGHASEPAIPEGTTLTFALAGNQNCGKTTVCFLYFGRDLCL